MVLHFIDECIRWHAAVIIPKKDAKTLIEEITHLWLMPYGSPKYIVFDCESALETDEARRWMDRWGITKRPRAPGQHATMAERHGALLRDHLHRLDTAMQKEGLVVTDRYILAESVFAKNAMTSVGKRDAIQRALR